MLNFLKQLKLRAQAFVPSNSRKLEVPEGPASQPEASLQEDKVQVAPCQSMVVSGTHLVFGGAWTPASEEAGWKKILNTARNDGYVNYALHEHESTVGLFGALPKDVQNAHAAALVLAQHFSAGGTELFVFQQDELCGLVAMMEYAPIPGYDMVGTQEQIQQLIREFNDINTTQLVHSYGNVNWVADIQSLELTKVIYKADAKSKLKPVPNIKLRVLMGLASALCVAVILFGIQEYMAMRQAEEEAMAATSQNPNLMYEQSLAMALTTAGEPGGRHLQVWRQFFAKVPLNVGGWNFKTLECKQLVCDIVWERSSGTFQSFENHLPAAMKAQTKFKPDTDLVKAEILTQHNLVALFPASDKKI